MTGDEHDAADLVQDSLLRGLLAADRLEVRSTLTTWLRPMMHNLWVDTTRSTREDPSDRAAELVETQWKSDDYTVDAAVVERASTRDDLREALTHLPIICRTAVVLHDAEGLTVAEIAEITGVGLPAAKQRLRRGRMMLVTALAQGGTPPQTGVPMRCWQARSQVPVGHPASDGDPVRPTPTTVMGWLVVVRALVPRGPRRRHPDVRIRSRGLLDATRGAQDLNPPRLAAGRGVRRPARRRRLSGRPTRPRQSTSGWWLGDGRSAGGEPAWSTSP